MNCALVLKDTAAIECMGHRLTASEGLPNIPRRRLVAQFGAVNCTELHYDTGGIHTPRISGTHENHMGLNIQCHALSARRPLVWELPSWEGFLPRGYRPYSYYFVSFKPTTSRTDGTLTRRRSR